MRRIPVPAPAQATASGLVGAAVFGAGAGATAVAAAPDPGPAATTTGQAGTDAQAGASVARAGSGVSLTDGGWLPDQVAEAAIGAAALGWLRRRRGYRAVAPRAVHGCDEDLPGDPRTVRAVLAALADPDAPPGTGRPRPGSGRAGAVVGQWPAGPVLRPGDLPAGVGLTGPGAADAARGILVAAVLTADAGGAGLVTTLATLAGLDLDGRHLNAVAGLTIAATIGEALARAQHPPPATTGADPAADGRGNRLRPLMILVDLRDGGDPAALTRLLASTPDPVTVVVLGQWPDATWQVLPDGTTTVDGRRNTGPRLCALGARATVDLLTVTGHLPPPDPTPVPPPVPARRSAEAVDPVLRLRVLGQVSAMVADRPLLLRRSAAWQILVYLAVHPAGATAAELTEAIWPHLRPATITGRLYTTISELRRTLHPDGVTVIDRAGDRYRLRADTVAVDLWRLTAAVNDAATAVGAENRGRALRTVIDSYPGDLAAGHDWPWLPPARETLRRRLIDAYAALAAQLDPPAALRLLRDAVAVDPLNEDLHRRAVRALAAVGDHDGIDDLLNRYARTLAEAGLPPSGDLRHDATGLPTSGQPRPPRPRHPSPQG
jgi:DNA-binding SARP family transcriptional activator